MFNIWLLFYVLLSGVFDVELLLLSVAIIGRCKALYNCMACNAIIQAITTKQATRAHGFNIKMVKYNAYC